MRPDSRFHSAEALRAWEEREGGNLVLHNGRESARAGSVCPCKKLVMFARAVPLKMIAAAAGGGGKGHPRITPKINMRRRASKKRELLQQ